MIIQTDYDIFSSPLQNKKIRIEILDNYFKVVSSMEGDVIGGSINYDANNDNRRSCNIEVVVPNIFGLDSFFIPDSSYTIRYGGKIWIDRNVKIWVGTQNLATDEYEWTNCGIYIIDQPTKKFTADSNIISFSGIDLMVRLSGVRGGQLSSLTTTIPQYQNEINTERTTLRGAFTYVLEDLANITNYTISDEIDNALWKYLPYDISVSAGGTIYDILTKLREIPSDWEMFFDENGVFIFQPISSGSSESIVDITEEVVSEEEVAVDFNNVKNQIIVYGGLNEVVRYTETVVYDKTNNRLRLYFDEFGWGSLYLGSKLGFKNLAQYNDFTIDNISFYIGNQLFAEDIPLVGSENTTSNIPTLTLEPNEVYIIRVLQGDVNTNGSLKGTNVVFDLYTRQQPRQTAVESNKNSDYYINNYVKKPNYYGGESKSSGVIYDVTINDEDAPISSLPSNTRVTFMPNSVMRGVYSWLSKTGAITTHTDLDVVSSIAQANGKYVATVNSKAYKSTDGSSWAEITGLTTTNAKVSAWENIMPTLRSIGMTSTARSIAYGNGIWVVANSGGLIATSSDGETWIQQTSSFGTTVISRVAYGNGLWVAVGGDGKLATSTNGVSWTQQTSSFGSTYIWSVAYGDGLWVAVGNDGKLATSSNGTSWTQQTSSFGTTAILDVAYANGLWIAVGAGGKLATSSNGTSWTPQTIIYAASIQSVAYGNGLWIIAGGSGVLATSSNGTSWTQRTSGFGSSAITSVAYGDGRWIAVGASGKLATSSFGVSWTLLTSSFGTNVIYSVAYNGGIWLCSGDNALLAKSVATSALPTGSYWQQVLSPIFILASTSALYTSIDATTWINLSSGYNYPASVNPSSINIADDYSCANIGFTTGSNIYQINYDYFAGIYAGRVITLSGATGSYGVFESYNFGYATDGSGRVYIVNNGTSTYRYTVGNNSKGFVSKYGKHEIISYIPFLERNSGGLRSVNGVCYGNGIYVAIGGNGGLATSPNGANWTQNIELGQYENLYAIEYANNMWMVGGASFGSIYTSTDGLVWAKQKTGLSGHIRHLAYGSWVNNGSNVQAWMAVEDYTSSQYVSWSIDGKTWSDSTTIGDFPISDIVYNGSVWVAIGTTTGGTVRISTSSNGVAWSLRTSPFGASSPRSVSYGNGVWVIVADGGKIATSTNGIDWTLQASGVFTTEQYIAVKYANGTWLITNGGYIYKLIINGSVSSVNVIPINIDININSVTTPYLTSPTYGDKWLIADRGDSASVYWLENNIYAMLTNTQVLTTTNINESSTWTIWQPIDFKLPASPKGIISSDKKLYMWGQNSSENVLMVSNNNDWTNFTNISNTIFDYQLTNMFVNTISKGATSLIGIFSLKPSSTASFYLVEQVGENTDLNYRINVKSSSGSQVAIGDIYTQSGALVPFGKFTNDYTIQIIKWDGIKFIYEGSLNNYLQVNIGGEYDYIPTDELCRQRANYELFLHSNLNDSITLNIKPMYYLNVNRRISYKNIYENPESTASPYLIKSMSIPLGTDGLMTINAIKLFS